MIFQQIKICEKSIAEAEVPPKREYFLKSEEFASRATALETFGFSSEPAARGSNLRFTIPKNDTHEEYHFLLLRCVLNEVRMYFELNPDDQ